MAIRFSAKKFSPNSQEFKVRNFRSAFLIWKVGQELNEFPAKFTANFFLREFKVSNVTRKHTINTKNNQ